MIKKMICWYFSDECESMDDEQRDIFIKEKMKLQKNVLIVCFSLSSLIVFSSIVLEYLRGV